MRILLHGWPAVHSAVSTSIAAEVCHSMARGGSHIVSPSDFLDASPGPHRRDGAAEARKILSVHVLHNSELPSCSTIHLAQRSSGTHPAPAPKDWGRSRGTPRTGASVIERAVSDIDVVGAKLHRVQRRLSWDAGDRVIWPASIRIICEVRVGL